MAAALLARCVFVLALLACCPRAAFSAEPDSATSAGEPPPAEFRPAVADIALVLPLESAAYGRAAAAVRAGFIAAADAAKASVVVIGHPDGDPVAGFARAKELGARVVVGPLVRDDLRTLAGSGFDAPATLALNQLDDGMPLPDRIYSLSLSIESEGRQLARLVQRAGARTVGIISANSPLQRRFASAFVDEWLMQGGGAPETFRFERDPETLTGLRKELARVPLDAVLLAVDGGDVALLKSFVGTVASFTSSQVHDTRRPETRRDLDAVYFVELPWLVDGMTPGLQALPRGNYTNASLQRLHALGIDALRIARMLVDDPPTDIEFDGATGRLRLGSGRLFTREGQLMRFRGGDVVAVDAVDPVEPPKAPPAQPPS